MTKYLFFKIIHSCEFAVQSIIQLKLKKQLTYYDTLRIY